MFWKDFFEITKKLDRNKYHIYCGIYNITECEWSIYRKDMSSEEYFSPENKAILTSKLNTEQELIDFCKKEE